MKVKVVREVLQYNNRRMKKARRRFVIKVRAVIQAEGSYALYRAAELAHKRGLWVSSIKDCQFYILRLMCKLDRKCGWHGWLMLNGWRNDGWQEYWIKKAA